MNVEPSFNKHEVNHKRKSYGPNTTQLRRSPRKKVSTTSVVNYNTYRSGIQKQFINIAPGDGTSIYSGDTNSIISNRRSLPGSTYQCSKKDKETCDKSIIDEKGDSRATRSGRTLGNVSSNSKGDNVIHNNTVLSNGNSDDNFKQKLRNAVYDALKGKDICEDHKVTYHLHLKYHCRIGGHFYSINRQLCKMLIFGLLFHSYSSHVLKSCLRYA